MSAAELVYEKLLKPTRDKEYGYVGNEFEYLIFAGDPEVSLAEIGAAFLKKLTGSDGFLPETTGLDGSYIRVERDGDAVSFDYSYHLLEFSLKKRKNLLEIQEVLFALLSAAQEYYGAYGCIIGGIGRDSFYDRPAEYTPDPFYNMIRRFLATYGGQSDLNRYMPNMASVQTHIDVPYDDMLTAYNLFNRMDFACALLFANSADLTHPETPVYCMRDICWEQSGNPNTGLYDAPFRSMEELAAAFASEEIFMEPVNGVLTEIRPVDLAFYFDKMNKPAENIAYYRSFKHVVINKYHVLEARSDCTQPVRDCMLPTAFRVGIAYECQKAAAEFESFFRQHRIDKSNRELREMAVCGNLPVPGDDMWGFLQRLYEIAQEGLLTRGLGEEKLLKALEERIRQRTNPAKQLLEAYRKGRDYLDLIREYSRIP